MAASAPPKIIVVGRGLTGSACARHLAMMGAETTLIGPDEPAGDWAAHDGVFASHYDEGRITRRLATETLWSRLSAASIRRYAEIEAASGQRVFTPVGAVMAGPDPSGPDSFVAQIDRVAAAERIAADRLTGPALAERFGYFAFPQNTVAWHEPADAGYVSPRALVRAQTLAAEKAGARIVRERVETISPRADRVEVATASGALHQADKTVLAAGGFSVDPGFNAGPLDLTVYARTVALFELDAAETARLAGMPSVIHKPAGAPDWYLLPPIPYPDGKTYLKIGGDPIDRTLECVEAICDWFRSGGGREVGDYLTDAVRAFIPGLRFERRLVAPCVTTFTRHGRPYIGPTRSERLIALTGGCGAAAKCSDELGRLGALCALRGQIAEPAYPEGFEPVFRDG